MLKARIYMFLLTFFLMCSCSFNQTWVLQLDNDDRPITGCMRLSEDALRSVIISVKCQKSSIDNLLICSEGRTIQNFSNKKDCDKLFDSFQKKNGYYSLKSDPYEK